jgi:hypothetical protein
MVIDSTFWRSEKTEENLCKAEEELNTNPLALEEGRTVEERETLTWLRRR